MGSLRCVADGAALAEPADGAALAEPVGDANGADGPDEAATLAEPLGEGTCALARLAAARVPFASPAEDEHAPSDETATEQRREARRTIETVRPASRSYSAEAGQRSAVAD